MTSPKYFEGSVLEAVQYGCDTFMFYTGAPQNSFRKPLNELHIEEGVKLLKDNGINPKSLVVHAPYIINGANPLRKDIRDLAENLILKEIERTETFGAEILVLHPGSHVGCGSDEGIKCLIKCLDNVFENNLSNVKIAIETMAGKGSEIGRSFEEVASIINGCKHPDRLGVCLDTCHISDAGYNLENFDEILNEFDRIIGLNKLLVLHINDSKNPRGSRKDRHENIGYGTIGFTTLCSIVNNDRLKRVPKILETPYFDDMPPYKTEIEMLRSKRFLDWKNKK